MTDPSRRSVRLKATHETSTILPLPTSQQDDSNGSMSGLDDDETALVQQRPVYRKKQTQDRLEATASAKRKRSGKLRSLLDMPMDILFEILGHLLPYDILSIARATKPFRRLLMQRSSAFVWKRARSNVPSLPDCPPGLSEPAYANLAFGTTCHVCGARGANKVSWYYYSRTCNHSDCIEQVFHILSDSIETWCEELGIPPERHLTSADIEAIHPITDPKLYYRPEQFISCLLEYGSLESEEERAAWKITKKAERGQRLLFAVNVYDWANLWKKQRKEDIEGTKAQRAADILDRLRAEGWGDVIDNFNSEDTKLFKNHKLVKQNKSLTDRIWNNIKPALVKLCGELRTRQHERHVYDTKNKRLEVFKKAFDAYCTTIAYDAIVAPLKEIVLQDSVQSIILDTDWDRVYEESDFQDIFAGIPQLTAEWKTRLDQHLLQQLVAEPVSNGDQRTPDGLLSLATSLFLCRDCGQCCLSYDQVLVHECWEPLRDIDIDKFTEYPTPLRYFADITKYPSVQAFKLYGGRDRMTALIQAAGLPEDISMKAFKELNPHVECPESSETCGLEPASVARHAVNWYGMLKHYNITLDSIKVLNHQDLVGKILIPVDDEEAYDDKESLFGCRHCYTRRPIDFATLKDHLSTCHDIEIRTAESMEHYVLHPAVLTKFSAYSTLYISS